MQQDKSPCRGALYHATDDEDEEEDNEDLRSVALDLGLREQFDRIVPVNEVWFTQRSISPFFSDRRCSFSDLIASLDKWQINPGTAKFLLLEV